jgi:TRAP-type C4-dicarboxylate transport system permease small subunit
MRVSRTNFYKFFHGARRISRFLNRAANVLSAVVIFIMVFYITADVLGRDLFSRPIPGTYEISEMLMVLVVFLGLAYTQAMGSHIRTEFVLRLFPPKGRLVIEICTHFIFLITFAFFVWEGTKEAIISWQEKEFIAGLINVPRYPARWAIPIGAFLVCLTLAFDIADRLRNFPFKGKTQKEGIL